MRARNRQAVSWVAIFAVALHAVLWAAAPIAAGAATDPLTVICHSEATTADQPAPASAPARVCDHCNLCSAAPALASLDAIVAGQLAPPRLLQILRPASDLVHGQSATPSNRARGPPVFA
jgi:hypothetical protein